MEKGPEIFSCCQWNVNSLTAHNKTSLLAADTSTQRYDIICLSETYLDSSVPDDTDGLPRKRYYLLQADHPGKIIRGKAHYHR